MKVRRLLALLAFLLAGCGGAGITLSARPQFAAQLSFLSAPVCFGPAAPAARCYGYANGYLLLGAPAKRVYRPGVG